MYLVSSNIIFCSRILFSLPTAFSHPLSRSIRKQLIPIYWDSFGLPEPKCFSWQTRAWNYIKLVFWNSIRKDKSQLALTLLFIQVEFDKRTLKFLRNLSISVTWFLYLPTNNFILLCTGPNGIHLQPYYIADSNFNKLPRLECEYSSSRFATSKF